MGFDGYGGIWVSLGKGPEKVLRISAESTKVSKTPPQGFGHLRRTVGVSLGAQGERAAKEAIRRCIPVYDVIALANCRGKTGHEPHLCVALALVCRTSC